MSTLLAVLWSGPELLIVLVVVLLLFGNRLPSVMRNLGQGVTEFKKGVAGIEDESDVAAKPADRKIDEQPKQQNPA